jgi:hypothetical protein
MISYRNNIRERERERETRKMCWEESYTRVTKGRRVEQK